MKTKDLLINIMNNFKPKHLDPKTGWKANKKVKPQPTVEDLIITSHAMNMEHLKKLYS